MCACDGGDFLVLDKQCQYVITPTIYSDVEIIFFIAGNSLLNISQVTTPLFYRALQLPPEAWLRMSLPHCSITRITIRPNGRVSLKGLGDAGHLPADMVTYN